MPQFSDIYSDENDKEEEENIDKEVKRYIKYYSVLIL